MTKCTVIVNSCARAAAVYEVQAFGLVIRMSLHSWGSHCTHKEGAKLLVSKETVAPCRRACEILLPYMKH